MTRLFISLKKLFLLVPPDESPIATGPVCGHRIDEGLCVS